MVRRILFHRIRRSAGLPSAWSSGKGGGKPLGKDLLTQKEERDVHGILVSSFPEYKKIARENSAL